IDIEGACEGSLACSTCHVIVDPEWYDLLKEASEDEEDMLDLAFGLTATSRLGCQIIITEELDGLVVKLPTSTRNLLLGCAWFTMRRALTAVRVATPRPARRPLTGLLEITFFVNA